MARAPVAAEAGGLVDKRLVIVAGKGGVGRTTLAAALAMLAARRGRTVLLCQTRARDALGPLLGCGEVGDQIVAAGPNLWAVNIDPRSALLEYGLMVLKFPAVARAVFENRALRAFLRAVPGLDEFAMLGKVCHHVGEKRGRGDRFDTVILDGPATGHLIQMLDVPRAVMAAMPAGPLAKAARMDDALLRDPRRTVAHIVTLPEEMPVAEAADLYRALGDLGIACGRLLVNGVLPDRWKHDGTAGRVLENLARSPLPPGLTEIFDHARRASTRHESQVRHLARLRQTVPLATVQLPALFVPALGAAEVKQLSEILEREF